MGQRIEQICLSIMGMGVIVLMCAVVVQVVCSAFDVNPVATFERGRLLIGDAITLNSLLDFQWHLLVIIGLLPAGLVWLTDRHVRVDFIYQSRSKKTQDRINLLGHLVFAAPFFSLVLSASWSFMLRAWTSNEGSRNGGLNDLWLIKAVLPIGLGLLALAILIETVRLIRTAR